MRATARFKVSASSAPSRTAEPEALRGRPSRAPHATRSSDAASSQKPGKEEGGFGTRRAAWGAALPPGIIRAASAACER